MTKLIFVQKLLHFEVCDFGRISYEKTDKIDILKYFTPNVTALSIIFMTNLTKIADFKVQ